MSTKLNIPLLIFALMIQSLFCGMMLILPASVTASFPSFANPAIVIAGLTTPPVNFGIISSLSPDWLCSETYCDCSVDTLFIGCIGKALFLIWTILLQVFLWMSMAWVVIYWIVISIFSLISFFLASSLYVISVFPVWISIPLGLLLAVIDILLVIDIALVIKGLIENII